MADVTQSKQIFASQMIALAREILNRLDDMDNLNSAFGVHGFSAGGANPFTDGDFATNNTHLTASIVADVMFARGTLDGAATEGVRNALRSCIPGGIP